MTTPKPSSSESTTRKRPISFYGMNVNQVKMQLTAQLNDKENALSKNPTSQISRNALIKQTDIIRKELSDLNKFEQEEELPDNIRSKLEGLANEFEYLTSSKSTSLQDNISKGTTGFSPLLPPPPTNSSPTKHRTKNVNGNRRNPDIEFATEIGQGLLIEVRKLQATLQEKEEIIKHLEMSKFDNERNYESSQRHLRQREEIEEKLKEENWNLEVANQELRTHLSESNQLVAKHNAEFSKLAKQIKSQSEQIDIMKAQEEKANSVIEAMKARHEQEVFNLRRHAASAQRENSQVQKQMEALNTELKICKAKLAVKLAASSRAMDEANLESDSANTKEANMSDTDSGSNSASQQISASPPSNNRNQAMEAETLKQSLAHAHRIISNLRSSLHKEKLEKFEVKKMLSDSQENIEQMRKEMSSWNTNNALSFGSGGGRNAQNGKKKALGKKRRGGVARRARGLCPNESDTETRQQKQAMFSNDEERDMDEEVSDSNMDEESIKIRKERLQNEDEINDFGYDEFEEEEDDDDDESLDEDFIDPQFSFGNAFGQTPFSSVPMMPLSSELEKKIQVIDIGINTDPVEFDSCPLEHVDQLVEEKSVTKSGNTSHPVSLTIQTNVPQESTPKDETEVPHSVPTANIGLHETPLSSISVSPESKHSNAVVPASVIINPLVQQQIAFAVIKEREDIAMRAQSIFSPEQVELLIPKQTRTVVDQNQVIAHLETETRDVQNADGHDLKEQEVELRSAIEKELKESMVPKDEVEKLLEDCKQTIRDEYKDTIPKTEVENIINEAKQNALLEFETKLTSEKDIRASVEKELKETMVPRVEVNILLNKVRLEAQSELEKTLEEMHKSEEGIKNAIEQELLKDMIPQTQANILVDEAIRKTRSELETIVKSENELRATIERDIKDNMVPKSEVDRLVSEARKSTRAEVEVAYGNQAPSHSRDINSRLETNPEGVLTKSEVDSLLEETKKKEREETEKIIKQRIAAYDNENRPKIEEELKATMVPKSEVDALLNEAKAKTKEESQKDMITKVGAEAMVLAAVATATASLKHEFEQHKSEAAEKLSKEQVDELVERTVSGEQEKAQAVLSETLKKQKDESETQRLSDLEKQKTEIDQLKNNELEKVTLELNQKSQEALEEQKRQLTLESQSRLESQKSELLETMKVDMDKQKADFEQAINEVNESKKIEIDALSARLESQKKEYDELKQRMLTMLTKDSVDVLIKRAVTEAIENSEKKYSEAMAGMISREYSQKLVKDEVEKALEKERKEVAEKEETYMITKVEAEALAKVAAADAIVKERQAMAALEKEMVTKEQAELMIQAAVKEALDKQKSETAEALAKERKLLKEKEEQMISREEADKNTKEAVQVALSEFKQNDKLESGSSESYVDEKSQLADDDTDNDNESTITSSLERSVSTSRLSPVTVSISPAPSISTPASSSRKLRFSNSISSLRRGISTDKKDQEPVKQNDNQKPANDNTRASFGSLRILETSSYKPARLNSKSSISLRELSKIQNSSTSISTISSNDEQASGRMPLPMNSNDSFPGFSTGGSIDMEVIAAITQTMIGEWMSKHTRKYVVGGISENKHQRFFWVHPYTKILYWSSAQPGVDGTPGKTKSAFIESVTSIPSNDTTGASPKSLLVHTPKRDIKVTATSLERHELWLKSLSYLLGRSSSTPTQEEPKSVRSSLAESSGQQQHASISSKTSHALIADIVNYDSDESEDMVNIRQCCDGKHDVSTLSRSGHHYH